MIFIGKAVAQPQVCAECLTDRDRIVGRRVLVYEDVCTTGSQLDAVAGFLIEEGGALDVEGVALTRAQWRPIAVPA